jgi:hypothetical protein
MMRNDLNSAQNANENSSEFDPQFMDRLSKFFERDRLTTPQDFINPLSQQMAEDTLKETTAGTPSWKRNSHEANVRNRLSDQDPYQYKAESMERPVQNIVEMTGHMANKMNWSHPEYIHRIKNPQDLFELGRSYMEDMRYGMRHFAFASINVTEEKEKTILGIAFFINQQSTKRVTIISSDFRNSFYSRYVGDFRPTANYIPGTKIPYHVYSYGNIDVLEIREIESLVAHIPAGDDVGKFFNVLFSGLDITLWDIPELSGTDTGRQIFFPLIRHTNNVTLVTKLNITTDTDIRVMDEYFTKFGVSIKGMTIAGE